MISFGAIWAVVTRYAGQIIAVGAAALAYWKGGADARAKRAREDAEAYRETRRRLDDAPDLGSDPDAARRWLREREAQRQRRD